MALIWGCATAGNARPSDGTPGDFERAAEQAAAEFGVPKEVLLGVSYESSWWEANHGRPSTKGGYGPMHLTDTTSGTTYAHRPGEGPVDATGTDDPSEHTLQAAAAMIGVAPRTLQRDELQNLRGGAALLASYQRQITRELPTDPGGWYGAVARYSQAADTATAGRFADGVFEVIRAGRQRVRKDGQRVSLPKVPSVRPATTQLASLRLRTLAAAAVPECPAELNCRFVHAAASNYQVSSRSANGIDVDFIVIHDLEGTYDGGVSWFQDPVSGVSAHYVMKADGSEATQMVATKDIAFHAGNYWVNLHGVGIELEGYAAQGPTWFTPAQYKATAALVAYLARRFDVPLDRKHIIGHDNVLPPRPARAPDAHWDPGPYWDWEKFMALLATDHRQAVEAERGAAGGSIGIGQAVTIAPTYGKNSQPVTVCASTCRTQTQPSNFLYVRTEPRDGAPLVSDLALHPDGSAGTNHIDDWGSTAMWGQEFVVADVQGDWTAIWFGGQKGWIHNPAGVNTRPAPNARIVRPASGANSISLYTTAYPRADEYPQGLPASDQTRFNVYTFPQGQAYVAASTPVDADDFFPATPTRREVVVTGDQKYDVIQYNRRLATVKTGETGR
ncbi:amidase [Streptomyces tanashiensis]|uniref:N-acetylmuramoyl-L-alanine amidase n=1 Tax=Streptomyces tanashiensis TaxID=67367 RepID=UPI00167A1791|nr:peptidoglycan recognition family protein [Streptomyces tanashiensis]GGS73181.1 amidase [Streptomyces tanashiensis]